MQIWLQTGKISGTLHAYLRTIWCCWPHYIAITALYFSEWYRAGRLAEEVRKLHVQAGVLIPTSSAYHLNTIHIMCITAIVI